MLRLLVLLLVLANVGYYAWSQRFLAAHGFAPATQTEPQRLAQQIKPDEIRIVGPQDTAGPESTLLPANAAMVTGVAECLQVGLFNEEQTVVLRERLVNVLPSGSWMMESVQEPARWLVYMGKYSSEDSVVKKKAELRALGVSFVALDNASLEPGLSLGDFKTQPEAETELARITTKGIKTAKVIQERSEQRGQRLKLAVVDAALRAQLDAIQPQLAGKLFQTCS